MGSSHSHQHHDDHAVAIDEDEKANVKSAFHLTEKQMKDIDTRFQELAKKGTISRNKFIQAFTGAGVGAEFAGIIFDSFDLDGNKKLTLNEWYSYMGVRMGGSIEDRLRASFNMFDRNHDGELTRSELVEVISLVEFHKQYYEQLCTGRILNNAGKIRLREKTDKIATDTVNRLFQKADADNSNTINVDEFVAGFLQDSESMSVLNLFQKGN